MSGFKENLRRASVYLETLAVKRGRILPQIEVEQELVAWATWAYLCGFDEDTGTHQATTYWRMWEQYAFGV